MPPVSTYALGLDLRLTTTEAGGRRTALTGGTGPGARFAYRPNWGLPHMRPPEQTGAFVLGFSRSEVHPGDAVRVVAVSPFAEMRGHWSRVRPGDVLPMYEGSRVCGHGRVVWSIESTWPLEDDDERRFLTWLAEPGSLPG